MPKNRQAFWNEKFLKNVERDRRNEALLRSLGWVVVTVWECDVANPLRFRRAVACIRRTILKRRAASQRFDAR